MPKDQLLLLLVKTAEFEFRLKTILTDLLEELSSDCFCYPCTIGIFVLFCCCRVYCVLHGWFVL